MNLEQMRTTADRLRNVPLSAVLLATGADHDRYDKARWHTPKGVISVTGMKFFNWNGSVGGGGAIDLIIHLYGVDFKGAVAWLGQRFGRAGGSDLPCPRFLRESEPSLRLPVACPRQLATVKQYLHLKRKLSEALIDYLIGRGDLYTDHHRNAVFVMRQTGDIKVGAELRGIGPRRWRGMAPGSCKDKGYFSIRNVSVDGIILCESAIDAISCFMIYPQYDCISTAGARPNPGWLGPLVHRYPHVYCGFDADATGDAMAQAMIQAYPTIKRLRPQQHDWNDTLRSQV